MSRAELPKPVLELEGGGRAPAAAEVFADGSGGRPIEGGL